MPSGYYKKGTLWGRDGYEIALGYTDYRFFFGTLGEAKKAACERVCTSPKTVNWKNMGEKNTNRGSK